MLDENSYHKGYGQNNDTLMCRIKEIIQEDEEIVINGMNGGGKLSKMLWQIA